MHELEKSHFKTLLFFPLQAVVECWGQPTSSEKKVVVRDRGVCWESPAAAGAGWGELSKEGGTLLVSQERANHPELGAEPPKTNWTCPQHLRHSWLPGAPLRQEDITTFVTKASKPHQITPQLFASCNYPVSPGCRSWRYRGDGVLGALGPGRNCCDCAGGTP